MISVIKISFSIDVRAGCPYFYPPRSWREKIMREAMLSRRKIQPIRSTTCNSGMRVALMGRGFALRSSAILRLCRTRDRLPGR
jgi:hypothetical protein